MFDCTTTILYSLGLSVVRSYALGRSVVRFDRSVARSSRSVVLSVVRLAHTITIMFAAAAFRIQLTHSSKPETRLFKAQRTNNQ